MARKRNYIGEAVVYLPKTIKKRVKPIIKQGQTRSVKGKETLVKEFNRRFWGKKR